MLSINRWLWSTRVEREAVLSDSASGMAACNWGCTAACGVAVALLERLGDIGPPAGTYPAELWWLACQALQRHEPALAQATRAQAVQWVQRTAQDHVPALYREGFLARNPFNAALLSEARRDGP